MLQKNQIIPLRITDVSSEGNGIGRYTDSDYPNGMVIFVPQTAPGDIIECRVVKVEKRQMYGRMEQLIEPSTDRLVSIDCPVYTKCGGCSWRHVTYEAELVYKQSKVENAIRRIGHCTTTIQPIIGASSIEAYRNKGQFPATNEEQGPRFGFYAPRSHRVIPCESCRLHPPVFADILAIVAQWMKKERIEAFDSQHPNGLIRHVFIRQNADGSQIMTALITRCKEIPSVDRLILELQKVPGMHSIMLNVQPEDNNTILGKESECLFGEEVIFDRLLDCEFRISLLSFYQVNHDQAEVLYRLVGQWVKERKPDCVFDLYCGTGTIGLTLAHDTGRLIGMEIVPEAVEDARLNARRNHIENATFICGDAKTIDQRMREERPDIVILDPPRKGCSTELINQLSDHGPPTLIYVSCNPATLARDLASLSAHYQVDFIQPIDMFPRTIHVESVVLLSR